MPRKNDPPPDPLGGFWEKPRREADLWAHDAASMLEALGLTADAWQVDLLRRKPHRALLNCSRQSGKTTATAVLALHDALFCPADAESKDVLLFAPAGRQSDELLRRITAFYSRLGKPVPRETDRVSQLDFADNGARIVPLPNSEESIRGFSPRLVIIDEASRVPDELYKAIRPMLAATKGRLICMSTPFGRRGFFYEEWIGEGRWERIKVTAGDCPRIDKAFLEDERRSLGDVWFRQEYLCDFTQAEGIVYPEWPDSLMDPVPVASLGEVRAVAGCDFGFNNPSAFVLGLLTSDDVLVLVEEIYGRRMTDDDFLRKIVPLCDKYQVEAIYCDSEAAGSIEKFRRADLPARKAFKKIDLGIRAVAARLRTGRLKCFRTLKIPSRKPASTATPTPRKSPSPPTTRSRISVARWTPPGISWRVWTGSGKSGVCGRTGPTGGTMSPATRGACRPAFRPVPRPAGAGAPGTSRPPRTSPGRSSGNT